MRLRRGARPVLGPGAPPRRRPCSDPMLRRAKVPGCGARSHEPGDAPPRRAEDSGQDPSCTRQSPLTLATFRSWGSSQDDAARGAAPECTRLRPGSAPADGVTDATAGDWPRRAAVRYIPYPSHAAGASPLTVRDAWRIRLVAYGARLESVLGASPRGFESPILRRRSSPESQWLRGCVFLLPTPRRQAPERARIRGGRRECPTTRTGGPARPGTRLRPAAPMGPRGEEGAESRRIVSAAPFRVGL